MTWPRGLSELLVGVGAWTVSSCAPSGFQDAALVNSVRILASSADKPFAKPGDQVTVQVLAVDERPTRTVPMQVFWLPFVCTNPPNDAYFGCFSQIARGGSAPGDGGTAADAGANSALAPRVDLTPFLPPPGPTFTFTMPADAVTSHPVMPGIAVPYGLAILFNVACAGHLEILPPDPSNTNPQTLPIGCFDADHNALGPNDWVFGFTRVYAYDSLTNANPVIASIDAKVPAALDGGTIVAVDAGADAAGAGDGGAGTDGGTDAGIPGYTASPLVTLRCTGACPTISIGPTVPASSQEEQSQLGTGNQPKEEIRADFFGTFGSFGDDARLIYDSNRGALGGPTVTDDSFTSPKSPGSGTIWIVVHDNRGGATWATVPVIVR